MDQSTLVAKQKPLEFFRPKPDGDIDPAGEAGWYLQRERERHGLTLDDVAATIGIHAFHLDAIETGDLTGLPAREEALAMVGAYADYLGFDPQPLVLHFANFLPHPVLPHPSRRKQRRLPLGSAKIIDFSLGRRLRAMTSGAGGIVASCLGAILLFAAASHWLVPDTAPGEGADPAVAAIEQGNEATKVSEDIPVASIARLGEEPLGDDEPITTSTIGAEADRAANSLDGLGALIETGIGQDGNEGRSAEVEVSDLAVAVTEPTSPREAVGGRVYGSDNKDARLVLIAKAPVWIRIEDRQGRIVVTRTLNSGDSYRVPNREGLVITARDGGQIAYRIDDKPGGDLGQPGEILVGHSLDLQRLTGG